MGDKPLSFYFTQVGPAWRKLPVPDNGGNGLGKVWHCPNVRVADPTLSDIGVGTAGAGGVFGVFSYVMNIDLKDTSPITASYTALKYPYTQKLSRVPHIADTVLLTEAMFSPTFEKDTAKITDADRNGLYPCDRSYRFPLRHNSKGGNLVFLDGHAAFYKRSYITNGAPDGSGINRAEKDNTDLVWNNYRN